MHTARRMPSNFFVWLCFVVVVVVVVVVDRVQTSNILIGANIFLMAY